MGAVKVWELVSFSCSLRYSGDGLGFYGLVWACWLGSASTGVLPVSLLGRGVGTGFGQGRWRQPGWDGSRRKGRGHGGGCAGVQIHGALFLGLLGYQIVRCSASSSARRVSWTASLGAVSTMRVPHTLFAPIGHAKSHRTLRCLHTFLWWLSPSPWRSPGDYLIRQQTRRGQTRLAEPAPRSGTAVEPAGSSEDPELGKAPNPEPRTGSPTTTGTLPQPAQQITTQIPSCATQGTGNSSRKHWEIKCGAPCASQVPLQPSC